MSQQINWGVCPEATHYLPAQIAGVGHNSFWCMNGPIPISKWREDGTFCANSGLFMNDADMARLIAKKLDRAPVALDWSTAPEDATHAWDDGHGGRWYKLEATGTLWLFKWGVWEFCQRNDGEPLDVSDLIPRPKAEPELPDKSKWPAGATHYTPKTGPNRRPVFWRVEGGLGLECWPVNEADMTVCDHMRYAPTGCVTFSMKGAIELPKAEEFMPVYFKTPAGMVAALIDAYRGAADRSTYRADLVDDLRKVIKAGSFDSSKTSGDGAETLQWDGSAETLAVGMIAEYNGSSDWYKEGSAGAWVVVRVNYMSDWTLVIECLECQSNPENVGVELSLSTEASVRGYEKVRLRPCAVSAPVAIDPAEPGSDRSVTTHRFGGEVVAVWERGLPPAGTDCNVTPHNTQWGFDNLDTRRVRVVAYHADHVWLLELHSDGSDSFSFITTRTDKVDFKPWLTPDQIAKAKRIAAVQAWLKDIERDYGTEVADQCEDILMEGENRLAKQSSITEKGQ